MGYCSTPVCLNLEISMTNLVDNSENGLKSDADIHPDMALVDSIVALCVWG